MELTPREKDKLLLFTASLLAERPKWQERVFPCGSRSTGAPCSTFTLIYSRGTPLLG